MVEFIRKGIAVLAIAPLVLIAAACSGSGEDGDKTLKLTLGAGHPAGAMTYTTHSEKFLVPELEKRVGEETDYTLKIDEQYGGTVTPVDEVLEGTRDGIVDIGLVPYQFEASTLPIFNFSNYVPFGSPDPDVVLKAGREAIESNKELPAILNDDFNQRALAYLAVGDYGLATDFKVSGSSDLKGKKLAGAGPNLNWVEPVGSTPIQGSLNEWYNGIQTGLYNGAIIFLDAYAGFKLNEVAPYFTRVGFGSVFAGGVHVNNDSWEKLPTEVQDVFVDVTKEYEDTFSEAIEADEKKTLDGLKGTKAKVSELPEDERRAWAEQLPNFPAEFVKENEKNGLPGKAVMEAYLKAMADAGYEFPRNWDLG